MSEITNEGFSPPDQPPLPSPPLPTLLPSLPPSPPPPLHTLPPPLHPLFQAISVLSSVRQALSRATGVVLVLVGARSAATYWQDAWLWEAASGVTLAVRSQAWLHLLGADLGFFEGRGGGKAAGRGSGRGGGGTGPAAVATGDLVYRLTAEAREVGEVGEGGEGGKATVAAEPAAVATGDLVYRLTAEAREVGEVVFAVLKAAVPAVCQVAVMLTRMVQLSPVMTLATLWSHSCQSSSPRSGRGFAAFSLVVPLMSVIIAALGERVRRVSSKAQASIAALSARITEVLLAMLLVKAHAAEPYEALLFRHLAEADRSARLQKKRLKALFPEAITAAYAAAVVVLFGVATWAVGQGGLTGAGIVSFFTSLVLLIEPIQAAGTAFNELKQGQPAIERVLALTRLNPPHSTASHSSSSSSSSSHLQREEEEDIGRLMGEIEFQGVCFGYGLPTGTGVSKEKKPQSVAPVAGEATSPAAAAAAAAVPGTAEAPGAAAAVAAVTSPAAATAAAASAAVQAAEAGSGSHVLSDVSFRVRRGETVAVVSPTAPRAATAPAAAVQAAGAGSGSHVLSDVSFRVRRGETVAVVGPSGGGKSSLLKLLLKLYRPSAGRILLDGQDLATCSASSVRRQIGFVPQETVLFSGTVAQNIAYGHLEYLSLESSNLPGKPTELAMVERAARLANAHEFISALPEGYFTQLGPRGASLSGGQRQRLAVARAIFNDPAILVLDEATSALDSQSEALVRDALRRLMVGRTVRVWCV
ncbi:unnamed protein product [Closterium sp. Naga37s-1]|nr:unnamed protein product [Closterium sp. Naga37s-1]